MKKGGAKAAGEREVKRNERLTDAINKRIQNRDDWSAKVEFAKGKSIPGLLPFFQPIIERDK